MRSSAVLIALLPALAFARAGGIVSAQCMGCHGGGSSASISVAPTPFNPGQTVTVTVTLTGNGANGGLYLFANGGLFALVAGQSTRLFNNEVLHSTPKPASAGKVTFEVQWTAPSVAGAVDFEAYTVMGNGNGNNGGDAAAYTSKQVLFGCAGNTYYRDLDADGVGSAASGTTLNCATPAGYSAAAGDCDDVNPLVKPGAIEACNAADDNCNGQVDEGLTAVTTYPDVDKDGYGAANGGPMTGCTAGGSRAPNNLDCNDLDPALHPGAKEVCNFRDDDCDGQYDEGVFAKCGLGLCQRTGTSCDSSSCTAGTPSTEKCNKFDDDCNGVADDGPNLCPNQQVCMFGECIGGLVAIDAGMPAVDAGVSDAGTPAADAGTAPPVDAGTVDPMPMPRSFCAVTPGAWALLVLLGAARKRGQAALLRNCAAKQPVPLFQNALAGTNPSLPCASRTLT